MPLIRSVLRQSALICRHRSTSMGDMSAFRIDYNPKEPIDVDNVPCKDPLQLFDMWFKEVSNSAEVREPNAMTVATCNRKGEPSARMVLLKGYDSTGFKFYTNYGSRKGNEMAENPNVALLFYWRPLHRQIRIEGTVEKLPSSESDSYFHSRPHGSQLSAAVSDQSEPIPSYKTLVEKYTQLEQQYPNESDVVPRPEFWGGYLVKPKALEFWQGQTSRLHRRLLFTKEKQVDDECTHEGLNGWYYSVISP